MGVKGDPVDTRAAVAAAINHALAQGVKATEIADGIGLSRQQVRNYRDQTHSPSLEVAVALASYLGVSLDELAGVAPQPAVVTRLAALVEDLEVVARTQASASTSLQELVHRAGQLAGAHGTGKGTELP